ncbi:hypothetical protein BFG04_03395 [Campylobacter pinnipediorum subsp. pinnipediorum]|uniref:Transformation system protein n=1 Tax=Campylobacter pinnipediorum subsp. pinnipediorum TaxID=1660067 RepID=A0AAX0LA15_9BACT|nr:CDC27 family protein [Campylobacter pinnipediorum]OPA77974.1 hypothetical protein BFG04_03395 [Campylobacter pinnipediorum subsp. pinnipediorum]
MLDFSELKELEKKYEQYEKSMRSKKRIDFQKYIILIKNEKIIFLLVMIIILAYSFLHNNISIDKSDMKSNINNEFQIKNIESKNKFEKEIEQNNLAQKIADKLEEKKQINNIENNKTTKQQNNSNAIQGWLKINTINLEYNYDNFTNDQSILESKDNEQIIPTNQSKEYTYNNKNNNKKFQIEIKNSETNDEEKILENNFYRTNDIRYAIQLAKYFLKNKEYEKALKWSLNANEIDNSNEDSWSIFAIAKYKLDQKSDALKVLKSYNKSKNSENINKLINKIESDTL